MLPIMRPHSLRGALFIVGLIPIEAIVKPHTHIIMGNSGSRNKSGPHTNSPEFIWGYSQFSTDTLISNLLYFSLLSSVSRLEVRCDDLQHCLDDLRASSPAASPFLRTAVTSRHRLRKRRSCGNDNDDDDDMDEEEEEEDDINGPKSLSAVEGLADADVFRRAQKARLTFLAPPTSWEMRTRKVWYT